MAEQESQPFFNEKYDGILPARFEETNKNGVSVFRVIGQKELVKTAVVVENSTATAVISFLKEDTGWTKRVGKIA